MTTSTSVRNDIAFTGAASARFDGDVPRIGCTTVLDRNTKTVGAGARIGWEHGPCGAGAGFDAIAPTGSVDDTAPFHLGDAGTDTLGASGIPQTGCNRALGIGVADLGCSMLTGCAVDLPSMSLSHDFSPSLGHDPVATLSFIVPASVAFWTGRAR